jgi:hypothetical protein
MSEIPDEEPAALAVVGPPTEANVLDYLTSDGVTAPDPEKVPQAYAAEKAAQRSVCKVPADDVAWPADLAEALCRRVAANLAVRKNPLSIETTASEFGTSMFRVGGRDAEVRRLEAPYRKRVVG